MLPYDLTVRDSTNSVVMSVIRESRLGRVGTFFAILCVPFIANIIVFLFTRHTLKGQLFLAAGFLFLVGALISATLLAIASFRSAAKSK